MTWLPVQEIKVTGRTSLHDLIGQCHEIFLCNTTAVTFLTQIQFGCPLCWLLASNVQNVEDLHGTYFVRLNLLKICLSVVRTKLLLLYSEGWAIVPPTAPAFGLKSAKIITQTQSWWTAITINVPLFKKLRDIIFFCGTITLWAISRDILRGPRLFWPDRMWTLYHWAMESVHNMGVLVIHYVPVLLSKCQILNCIVRESLGTI